MELAGRFRKFISKGHVRSVKAKKNVLLSVFYKGLGVLIAFAYFPISLAYLTPVEFGIFLTLASIIDWFAELDIGIGAGLRNKLGEAVADNDTVRARAYISTAYYFLGSVFFIVVIVFFSASYFLPWAQWLQADASLNDEIALLALLMFGAFAIRFVFSLIYEVLYTLQEAAQVNLFNLITKALFLVIIIALYFTTESSLVLFGAAKTFTFALVPVAVGIFYFKNKLAKYKPSYRLVDRSYFKSLFSIGSQYLVIRLSMVVIHMTNNFLIASYVSVAEVPEYEAAYKYLSIFLMLFVILTNQLWAANVEAFRKGELDWMKNTLQQVLKLWIVCLGIMIIMVLVSPVFFKIWLQGKIEIPFMLTIAVAISIALTNWVNLFNLLINGTGKITLQMLTWLSASVLNIPISIILAQYFEFGTLGIVLGTILCMIPLAIISPIQVKKILSEKDSGIWSK